MIMHKTDYFVLAIVSALYMGAIFRFRYNPFVLLLATIIYALAYLIWGIFHQLNTHNFHARLVLEYSLVALLGVVIVSTLLI